MGKKKKDSGPVVLTRPNGDPLTPRVAPMIQSAAERAFSPLANLRPASRIMMGRDSGLSRSHLNSAHKGEGSHAGMTLQHLKKLHDETTSSMLLLEGAPNPPRAAAILSPFRHCNPNSWSPYAATCFIPMQDTPAQ